MITEFVKFNVLETTTTEQLLLNADVFINDFQKKQDGFIDVELVKEIEGNEWCFIFHYENLEKIKAIGEKMRKSKEFNEFKSLVVPESMNVTFRQMLKRW